MLKTLIHLLNYKHCRANLTLKRTNIANQTQNLHHQPKSQNQILVQTYHPKEETNQIHKTLAINPYAKPMPVICYRCNQRPLHLCLVEEYRQETFQEEEDHSRMYSHYTFDET